MSDAGFPSGAGLVLLRKPSMIRKLLDYFRNRTHKYKVGDRVIFVNDFGVVYLWTISELTTWETASGKVLPAYHPMGTQTPWFPYEESRLHKATDLDKMSTPTELQKKYGFTPTE